MFKYVVYRPETRELEVVERTTETIDYDTLNKTVGGWIEMVSLDPYNRDNNNDIAIVINEEGKLLGLDRALYWADRNDILCGNVMFVSHNEDGETICLTDKQVEVVKNYIDNNRY